MEKFDLSGITHLTQDSRQVRAGSLFVALKGTKVDGTQYLKEAESNGAVAALVAEDAELPETSLRLLRSREPRRALSQIAAKFYGKQPEHMVAVTGTDGKTSTADFFRQFAHLSGKSSASIGTLGILAGDGKMLHEATHTTPDPIQLHRLLAELVDKHITHVGMEASSHGLDQYRLHGVALEAAAFTNIARDHLDYHHTEQAYFEAKAKLFSELLPGGKTAVINADDKRADELRAICAARGHRVVEFGYEAKDFRILNLTPEAQGQVLLAKIDGMESRIQLPLAGSFQAMNVLAAMALGQATGLELDILIEACANLKGVPGRLELAATLPNGAAVYVDYAHTPMALANILKTLRPHTSGKLHVVFGAGGDRDKGKRPEMGKAAHELADVAIVTDDNPRSEDPATIRAAILAAAPGAQEIGDRVQAIHHAVKSLQKGDVLVIAGKGHEKTQTVAGVDHAHDDVDVARKAVTSLA